MQSKGRKSDTVWSAQSKLKKTGVDGWQNLKIILMGDFGNGSILCSCLRTNAP